MRFSSCGLGEIVQWLEQWNHKTTILLRSSAVPGRSPGGPLAVFSISKLPFLVTHYTHTTHTTHTTHSAVLCLSKPRFAPR